MNKRELKVLFSVFLLSRLIFIIYFFIKKDINVFNLYDSIHYINMANSGYSSNLLMAFFPLYPLLIKVLSFIIPNYIISGILISNICSFVSLLLLSKILNNNNNKFYYLCIFLFSPILAYTTICYTESLFMMLTLFGYYLYKKDRYILSAIIIGLSILTRNSGIILWGAIGLDMLYRLFKNKDIKFNNIILFGLISLIIGLIYPIYLYIKTGNFFEFITVQNTLWFREKGLIINGIIKDIKIIINSETSFKVLNIYTFILNWLSVIFTFILGIKIFKKDKVSSIYIIVSIISFTSMYRNIEMYPYSLSSVSLFRYIFNLFPIYLYIFENKKESSIYTIFIILFSTSIINTILFYSGYFIA